MCNCISKLSQAFGLQKLNSMDADDLAPSQPAIFSSRFLLLDVTSETNATPFK